MNGRRDPLFGFGDPFANFGGFGGQQDLASSFFGGRDPFADPFFTRPFGGMFESGFFSPSGNPFVGAQQPGFLRGQQSGFLRGQQSGFLRGQPAPASRAGRVVIEELNSDEEKDEKEGTDERKDNPRKHGRSNKEPLVEDPDDEAEGRRSKQMQFWNGNNPINITQPQRTGHSFSFQSSTVSYGGGNGAYYTSSTTRRTGSDGITFEESKEANSANHRATHRIARGIHEKGHSVTRKLNSDGRVDTMQTLHNLEEDELAGFEEKWKGNAEKHLPGWNEGLNMHGFGRSGNSISNAPNRGGWALPYVERSHQPGYSVTPEMEHAGGPPRPRHVGKAKADVGGKSGGSGSSYVRSRDQARKQ